MPTKFQNSISANFSPSISKDFINDIRTDNKLNPKFKEIFISPPNPDNLNKDMYFIKIFYFQQLFTNGLIFNNQELRDGINCIVLEYEYFTITNNPSLDSDVIVTLSRGTLIKVTEKQVIRKVTYMKVVEWTDDQGVSTSINGWVNLFIHNPIPSLIPEDYFTNNSYDSIYDRYVGAASKLFFIGQFLSCNHVLDTNQPIINILETNRTGFKIESITGNNPLFSRNNVVLFLIHDQHLKLAMDGNNNYISIDFKSFSLSSFKCESFELPGSFELMSPLGDNHFAIRISKYEYNVVTHIESLGYNTTSTNHNTPIVIYFKVDKPEDLLKVKKMYASIEIYTNYLIREELLTNSECAALHDAA